MKYLKYAKGMLIAAGFLLSAYFFIQESGEKWAQTTVVQLGEAETTAAAVLQNHSPAACTCAAIQPVPAAENTGAVSAFAAESGSPEFPAKVSVESSAETAVPAGEAAESIKTVSEVHAAGTPPLINLNTAGREELMQLKGIGEARAEAIIAYREEFGPFAHIEEIMNISGIKEAAFEKIKDDITV